MREGKQSVARKKICLERSNSEFRQAPCTEPFAAPLPQKREDNAANTEVHNASETNDTCSSCAISTRNHISSNDPVGGRVESESDLCKNEECLNIVSAKDKEIERLRKLVEKERREAALWRKKFVKKEAPAFSAKVLNTDKKVKTFLGVPSKAAFEVLFKLLSKKAPKIKYWQGPKKHLSTNPRNFSSTPKKSGPSRLMSVKDELVMTLMKLRLGSLNADLAVRFGVSETTVSKVINTWVRFLAKELKCLIYNPCKDVALPHLPKKFNNRKYKNVKHIIDCTEMFIETPKDPKIKAATWSDYKHHHTLKVLVSIMPCGSFNFVSEAWGGRASDVAITRQSGFYDILEYGDEVMADKGFTIGEDLLIRHARLHMPPGKRGSEQMRKQDVVKTKEIANLRIFVEQAIRRLKTFRILKHEMPILLLDKFDDIVTICAALCNLYPKLCY